MGNFALNVPINSVSYGAVSIGILREIYKRGLSPSVFCIGGGADLSAQKDDQDFNLWLQGCLNKSIKLHKRTDKVFKLWHLNSCLDSMSKFQGLYFFHETNQPTEEELNAVNNQDVCFVSSQYTKHVFEEYGAGADAGGGRLPLPRCPQSDHRCCAAPGSSCRLPGRAGDA